MKRRPFWWLLIFFAFVISAYALALLAVPAARPPFLRERFAVFPLATYVHLLGGAVALAAGPFQFLAKLRAKRPGLHRVLGRVYVVSILSSGTGGFILAFVSQEGMAAHLGFASLAVAWIVTGALAYRRIRVRDVAGHRDWMLRSYALTLAGVTLRIYLPLSLLAGVPFAYAYPAISWLCWVPNLLVVERLVSRRRRGGIPDGASVILGEPG
ncbi:MAG: DUF2306 domain-containing protein [Thermoanaerobaculia bacterium]